CAGDLRRQDLGRLPAEALGRPRASFRRHFLAISRRGLGLERVDELPCHAGRLLDRAIEYHLVGLRRLVEPAQLADELQRCRPNLLIGGWRVEVEQHLDVSAHSLILAGPHPRSHQPRLLRPRVAQRLSPFPRPRGEPLGLGSPRGPAAYWRGAPPPLASTEIAAPEGSATPLAPTCPTRPTFPICRPASTNLVTT